MPVYEYYCPSCRTTFEKLQRQTATMTVARCREGHEGARKLLSSFTVGGRTAFGEPAMPATGGCACGGNCSCGG